MDEDGKELPTPNKQRVMGRSFEYPDDLCRLVALFTTLAGLGRDIAEKLCLQEQEANHG